MAVPPKSILGILGPNGAGKTTLLRNIINNISTDSGTIEINGEPLSPKHARLIGYLPEEREFLKNESWEQLAI